MSKLISLFIMSNRRDLKGFRQEMNQVCHDMRKIIVATVINDLDDNDDAATTTIHDDAFGVVD